MIAWIAVTVILVVLAYARGRFDADRQWEDWLDMGDDNREEWQWN